MIKYLLVVMFLVPAFAAGSFCINKQWAGMLTWGGIAIANFGIWLQTT